MTEKEPVYHDMTEEEYDALEKLMTKTTPKVTGDGKSGFFMQHKDEIVLLDNISATYLRAKAQADHKTPTEIIGEMVRERITAIA